MRRETTERCEPVSDRAHPVRSAGEMRIRETKGEESEQERIKHRCLDKWGRAVNAHGGFGHWRWAVAKNPGEIRDILMQAQSVRGGA